MTRKIQEQGFSVIGILVIVAVVAAIGMSGWYIWHKNSNNQSVKSTTGSQTGTKNTEVQADPSEGGKYLVISEWNVRVLLPNNLKGNVFYALREYDDTDSLHYEAADINSKMFQPECRSTAADLGLDVIRTSSTPANTTGYSHLGNFWYGIIYGKDGCGKFLSGDKVDAFNQLRNSIRTVELIN